MEIPTLDQSLQDTRYSMALWRRYQRFNLRFHTTIQVIQLGAALGAFRSLVTNDPWLATVVSTVVAGTVLADMIYDPTGKAIRAMDHYRDWAALRTSLIQMSDEQRTEAFVAVCQLQEKPALALPSLRHVAYNDMLAETGRSDNHLPLTPGQRFMRVVS